MGARYQPRKESIACATALRAASRAGTARQTNVNRGPAPGRVILQLPDLYGNIISSALDVIIEPDETTDACVRKF